MKKIFVLALCMLLSSPVSFAQGRKNNAESNRTGKSGAQSANTRSSYQNSAPKTVENTTNNAVNNTRNHNNRPKAPTLVKPSVKSKTDSSQKTSSSKRINKSDIKNASGGNNQQKRQNQKDRSTSARQKSSGGKAVSSGNRPQQTGTKNNNSKNNANKNNNYRQRDTNRQSGTSSQASQVSKNYSGKNSNTANVSRPNRPSHHSPNYNKKPQHKTHYRPKTYYPYSYYYRSSSLHSLVSFFLFPFGSVSFGYGYRYHYPYYRDYYYYWPYTGYAVNNYNYTANYSYFSSDKLSADYTMLANDEEDENGEAGGYFDTNYPPELIGIKLRNTRLITGDNNMIGFEIDNGSNYYIASISFSITIRGIETVDTKSGILYKLEKPLGPGKKEFYRISLDDLSLDIPDSYTVFAEVESITTPSGSTIIDDSRNGY